LVVFKHLDRLANLLLELLWRVKQREQLGIVHRE
jgi:hypothetical protein